LITFTLHFIIILLPIKPIPVAISSRVTSTRHYHPEGIGISKCYLPSNIKKANQKVFVKKQFDKKKTAFFAVPNALVTKKKIKDNLADVL